MSGGSKMRVATADTVYYYSVSSAAPCVADTDGQSFSAYSLSWLRNVNFASKS